ncbi:MAG: hypothetical protein KH050_06030 [Clostridiaceae bacterium]|nr:hypothetical protein [Clostridiaceae bacterium]
MKFTPDLVKYTGVGFSCVLSDDVVFLKQGAADPSGKAVTFLTNSLNEKTGGGDACGYILRTDSVCDDAHKFCSSDSSDFKQKKMTALTLT